MRTLPCGSATLLLVPSFGPGYEEAWADAVAGVDADDALLAVGFDAPDRALSRWRQRLDATPERFALLCAEETTRSTAASAAGDADRTATVRTLSDPADLTTLGVRVTEFLYEEGAASDGAGVHVAVESLTTLLHYVDTDRLYQFVHTLTGRLAGAGADGVFHVDPTAHDERTLAVLRGLFDRVVEVDDEGDRRVSVRPGLAVDR